MRTTLKLNLGLIFASMLLFTAVCLLQPLTVTAQQWTNGASSAINNTNSGNVGVGTTTPAVKLHVVGGIYSSQVIESANTSGFRLVVTGPGDSRATWSYDGGTTTTRLTSVANVRTSFGSNGINDRMLLDLSGKLGIGTTTPGSLLHVNGSVFAPATSGSATNSSLRIGSAPFTNLVLDAGINSVASPAAQYSWLQSRNQSNYSLNLPLALNPNGGNVGIGTIAPSVKLDVQGGSINSSGGLCIAGDCKTAWSQVGGSQWTTSGTTINYNTGNVGIGTATPTAKLHVVGDGTITGNLTVSGTVNAKYQDMAEWVPSSQTLAAGTVVVLDSAKSNNVVASEQAYDTQVAGVISAQPGLALGEGGEGKLLVATTGRVKVKVDASSGPIKIGDLLVTGDKQGFAMKSIPVDVGGVRLHRPGTLIGKALEPLVSGQGEILVLLSLQ